MFYIFFLCGCKVWPTVYFGKYSNWSVQIYNVGKCSGVVIIWNLTIVTKLAQPTSKNFIPGLTMAAMEAADGHIDSNCSSVTKGRPLVKQKKESVTLKCPRTSTYKFVENSS